MHLQHSGGFLVGYVVGWFSSWFCCFLGGCFVKSLETWFLRGVFGGFNFKIYILMPNILSEVEQQP